MDRRTKKLTRKRKLSEYYQRYDLEIDGTHTFVAEGVVVHNTNVRMGLVMSNDELTWMCGSHRSNRKQLDTKGEVSLYWRMLSSNVQEMLAAIQHETKAVSVILFGEIYGPVQDMTYRGVLEFAAFDISVNGQYMNWVDVVQWCNRHCVPMVPVLYEGPFSEAVLMEHTDGPTTVCEKPVSKFKGREGVVVKPVVERRSNELPNNGRVILKSVSVDYLNRRGATDNA